MADPPILITDRLRLRGLGAGDRTGFLRLTGDPRVRRFLGGVQPYDVRQARFAALTAPPISGWSWAVTKPESDTMLGVIELSRHKDGEDHEVSYQFDPDQWGNGFASEAARRVRVFAITDLGLPRIIAETQTANHRSRAVLDRLGMVEIARIRRFGADQVLYGTGSS
ncbi:N-acetyltransferase [Jannaschia pagri]|uniref:N-acetyltransferase n=1 Tax=Jannaschia pagri TaxID=2829797 RepID=A0ABQ4NJQ3_9RHOB|nr:MULTISPECIES: GNAT family N-acetyltransferase [unclassified Jannaschia]GIT89575.1 N-acetyltransferase [Jannaschia sp. AI_61]GIT94317.1 N-acetyltransferase [Jannaschia sp. AI_62]